MLNMGEMHLTIKPSYTLPTSQYYKSFTNPCFVVANHQTNPCFFCCKNNETNPHFIVAKIIKQIHVFVVANFTQNLKSIKKPPAICKSFLCQKEIQQEKIKIQQSINQSAHLQVHKQFNMETLNWERCSRSARSKSKCTQIQKSQEKLIPTLQKLGRRTNNLSRTLQKLQDNSLKTIAAEPGQTQTIPQDHHYRQKRNWKKNQTNLSRSSSLLQIQLVHKRRICYNMWTIKVLQSTTTHKITVKIEVAEEQEQEGEQEQENLLGSVQKHVNHKNTSIYYHPQSHCQDWRRIRRWTRTRTRTRRLTGISATTCEP